MVDNSWDHYRVTSLNADASFDFIHCYDLEEARGLLDALADRALGHAAGLPQSLPVPIHAALWSRSSIDSAWVIREECTSPLTFASRLKRLVTLKRREVVSNGRDLEVLQLTAMGLLPRDIMSELGIDTARIYDIRRQILDRVSRARPELFSQGRATTMDLGAIAAAIGLSLTRRERPRRFRDVEERSAASAQPV